MLPSRRSSLESAEERELKALQSRPSTAYSGPSGVRNHVSVDITSLSKSPRLTSDVEEEGGHDAGTPGERRSRQPVELAFKQMLLSPRRMSITRFDCHDL